MELYDIIADNYSRIFPLSTERLNFVLSFLKKNISPGENPHHLDLGCATGDLCIEILKAGYRTSGIDLNSRMITIAKRKARAENVPSDFRVMDMRKMKEHFQDEQFTLITCFGNTIPHLDSLAEVTGFFRQVYSLLSSNGTFVFQILNYNKILDEHVCEFPVIKQPDFTFNRKYTFQDNGIRFIIGIEIDGKKVSDSTLLFPLRKESAALALGESGLRDIRWYRDYSLQQSTGKEFSLLCAARKENPR